MSDVREVKQQEISGFFYKKNNLNSLPVSLFTFGRNIVESLSKSRGSLNPIYAPDPSRPNKVDIIDLTRSAPELGELSFRERVHLYAYNFMEREFKQDCDGVFIFKLDNCGARDTLQTWSRLFVVDRARISNISLESIQAFDESNPVEMTGTFNHINWESILPIRFSEVAGDTVVAEGIDVIYYDERSCGSCSVYSEGCDKSAVLAIADTASPGLSAQLVWTDDHWVTETSSDITTLGGATARRLAGVGTYIVVVSPDDSAHHYVAKSNPSGTWFRVSSGYAGTGFDPTCIYAKSPSEVFFGAESGVIYKSEDITTSVEQVVSETTTDINDIHGTGQVIVAVGVTNNVLLSTNNGESFGAITGPAVGVDLEAVWCVSTYQWYVGDANGALWYTLDQGDTWTQRTLPDQGDLATVWDIKFDPEFPEVGAIAIEQTVAAGGAGLVYRTVTGGRTWFKDDPGIAGLPVNDRINAIALCGVNEIAAAGLADGSTDGLIAVAR